jgi:hypothetical protein
MSEQDDEKVWWHTDSKGRKIGYMWPEDLLAIIDSIWGRRKGIKNFARYTGHTRSTAERWTNGTYPIPIHIALLAEYIQNEVIVRQRHRTDYKLKPYQHLIQVDADWLPGLEKKKIAGNPYP